MKWAVRVFLAGVFMLAIMMGARARATAEDQQGVLADSLRCEWRVNPLGVDSAAPHFSWTLHSSDPARRGIQQTAYQIQVTSSMGALAQNQGIEWDSGKISSSQMLQVPYSGRRLLPATSYFWKVRVWDEKESASAWSVPARFTTGLLTATQWQAHWIAAEPDAPPQPQAREHIGPAEQAMKPLPIFRHEFAISNTPVEALVFVSGLGQYELHINGQNVTDAVLTPGWTNYRKHVFYNTYDVTRFLRTGANALGVMLGNGMYNVPHIEGRYTKFAGSFGQPKLILELHLRFADGSVQIIASDRSWRTSPGPVTFTTIYGGEDYDARREQSGWDMPGFHDAGWTAALEVAGPGGELTAELSPAVKVMHTYAPVKITQPRAGVSVYDLGQNFSGWPQITVRGPSGATVKLTPGELLDPSGLVSQHSANASPKFTNSFSYTLKGGGEENWHPRFTYYGFRYVQVEGAASETNDKTKPIVVSLAGQFIHDDVNVVGQFATSDHLFERVHNLIDMAVLSNMVSVLTDCPHREKLGWLEQTHLAGPSIFLNYDVLSLYRKMGQDLRDSQLPDGMVPGIAPEYVAFVDKNGVSTPFRDSPEWGSASVLSPWTAYQFSGDKELLAAQYESMRAYVAYLAGKSRGHLLDYGLGDWYDIGPGAPGYSQLTGKPLTATAIYYQDLMVIGQVAQLLSKHEDARRYSAEAEEVKKAFNANLFHPESGQYDRGSQTANAMPLVLGLVPAGQEQAVLQHLVKDIRNHGNHVTAGDIGFHYVVRALTDAGRSDVLYDMLSLTDSPSYGYQLARGATTLTEAWDTNPDSSQNHFMLGHGEEWFYRGLAGLSLDFSRSREQWITYRPNPVGGIENASATYQSVLGELRSAWSHHGRDFTLSVTVPAGCSATVEVPTSEKTSVRESGRALEQAPGILHSRSSEHGVMLLLASGQYEFTSTL